MSEERRLFGNKKEKEKYADIYKAFYWNNITFLVVIFTSGFHQMKGKIAGYTVAQFICPYDITKVLLS